jgi:hypothetical protein
MNALPAWRDHKVIEPCKGIKTNPNLHLVYLVYIFMEQMSFALSDSVFPELLKGELLEPKSSGKYSILWSYLSYCF